VDNRHPVPALERGEDLLLVIRRDSIPFDQAAKIPEFSGSRVPFWLLQPNKLQQRLQSNGRWTQLHWHWLYEADLSCELPLPWVLAKQDQPLSVPLLWYMVRLVRKQQHHLSS
jgi:hypothetical protein